MALLSLSPDLQILNIGLDISSTEAGEVVCSLKAQGESALPGDAWRVSSPEVGLPRFLDRQVERSEGYAFQMPGWVVEEVRHHLAPGHPLWLRLERPAGYLAAVPWERIFQPALGVPILRLPEVEAALPRETPGVLDVLLCASAPVAKEHIDVVDFLTGMADRILAEVPRRLNLHVFVDQGFYDFLRDRWGDRPGILYDPQTAASYSVPEASERVSEPQGRLQSPWLLWMRDSLQGRSMDVAHFLCHGSLSSERGALCFAESPLQNTDRRMSRFVGSGEIATFLTQIGVWSAAFSSPPRNYSEIGLRLFADTLAQVRPGPVLHHDLPRDTGCAALGEAYRFLYGPPPGEPPASPALALLCQPSRVERPEHPGLGGFLGGLIGGVRRRGFSPSPRSSAMESTAVLESVSSDPLTRVFAAAENVPSWIAATTRYVEQQTVHLAERAAASADSLKSDPVAETLRQIRDIVAHAAERSGEKS